MNQQIVVNLKGTSGLRPFMFEIESTISGKELSKYLITNLPNSLKDFDPRIINEDNKNIEDFGSLNDFINHSMITLKLWFPLRGGKGGLGEQLKNTGKVRKNNGENEQIRLNKRTLDGQRLKDAEKIKNIEKFLKQKEKDDKKSLEEKKSKLVTIISSNPSKNIKFEDTKYLEMNEKLVDDIKSSFKVGKSEKPKQKQVVKVKSNRFFEEEEDE